MKYTISALTLFSVASSMALADSITMLDGKKYPDCEFVYETAKDITVSIPVSASIKEDITLPKDKIAAHIKSTADELEYKKLAKRYAQAVPATGRADAIASLEAFEKKYPQSQYLKAVGELKAPLVSLKTDDVSSSEEEAPAEMDVERFLFDVNANKLYARYAASIRASQPVVAMQHFERLRKDFAASKAYAKAYPSALKIAKFIQKDLNDKSKTLEEALLTRRKSIMALPIASRGPANQAIAEATTKQREAVVAIKAPLQEKRLRWFTPPEGNLVAHKELLNVCSSEITNLGREADKTVGAATPLFVEIWKAIDENKVKEARTLYLQIRATKVPAEYLEKLQAKCDEMKQLDDKKKEADRLAAAQKRDEELEAKLKEREEAQRLRKFDAEKARLAREDEVAAKRSKSGNGVKPAPAPPAKK